MLNLQPFYQLLESSFYTVLETFVFELRFCNRVKKLTSKQISHVISSSPVLEQLTVVDYVIGLICCQLHLIDQRLVTKTFGYKSWIDLQF